MPLIKYTIEYPINTSASMLYKKLSTASGLSEWFADNVNIKEDILTFFWDGSEEEAKLLKKKKDTFIQLQWTDKIDQDQYFEMRIQIDEMTNDLSLIVTDFADNEEEKKEEILFWDTQLSRLKNSMGI